jgi:hypothetical protein
VNITAFLRKENSAALFNDYSYLLIENGRDGIPCMRDMTKDRDVACDIVSTKSRRFAFVLTFLMYPFFFREAVLSKLLRTQRRSAG